MNKRTLLEILADLLAKQRLRISAGPLAGEANGMGVICLTVIALVAIAVRLA